MVALMKHIWDKVTKLCQMTWLFQSFPSAAPGCKKRSGMCETNIEYPVNKEVVPQAHNTLRVVGKVLLKAITINGAFPTAARISKRVIEIWLSSSFLLGYASKYPKTMIHMI
jgi:hypothetical protein